MGETRIPDQFTLQPRKAGQTPYLWLQLTGQEPWDQARIARDAAMAICSSNACKPIDTVDQTMEEKIVMAKLFFQLLEKMLKILDVFSAHKASFIHHPKNPRHHN